MVHIRRHQPQDFDQYIALCQRVFTATYVSQAREIPAELFSLENFLAPAMQAHFKATAQNTDTNAAWIAEVDGKIVGTISVAYRGDYDEVHGFYDDLGLQGQGIGTQLWEQMLRQRKNTKIVVDVFRGTNKTIAMYKKWGFRRPLRNRVGYIHWDDWPQEYVLQTIRMYRRYGK
jgi:GNAT superfamily N-acetyltransferase